MMSRDNIPLMRLRRRNGALEELTLGPSAGQLLVRVTVLVLAAVLVLAGATNWTAVLPLLRALLLK